jgi:hypothetical protein
MIAGLCPAADHRWTETKFPGGETDPLYEHVTA